MVRALRMLEQERRTAGLHGAVDNLRDLEVRVDLGDDADELALALEQRDPVAEILGGHGAGQSMERAYATASSSERRRPSARPHSNSRSPQTTCASISLRASSH